MLHTYQTIFNLQTFSKLILPINLVESRVYNCVKTDINALLS